MTKEEYVKSLVIDNVDGDQWFDLIKQWEIDNPETEEVVAEGNSNDLPLTDAVVGQENVASEDTESELANGSSELPKDEINNDPYNIRSASSLLSGTYKPFQTPVNKGEALTFNDVANMPIGQMNAYLEPAKQQRAYEEAIESVAKPNETYGGYDNENEYKYNIEDGKPNYYSRPVGSEDEAWELHDSTSDKYFNIGGNVFKHFDFDESVYNDNQSAIENVRGNMVTTGAEINTFNADANVINKDGVVDITSNQDLANVEKMLKDSVDPSDDEKLNIEEKALEYVNQISFFGDKIDGQDIELTDNQHLGINLDGDGFIVSKSLSDGSSYQLEENEGYNQTILKKIKAGTHAYNPKTRVLKKLPVKQATSAFYESNKEAASNSDLKNTAIVEIAKEMYGSQGNSDQLDLNDPEIQAKITARAIEIKQAELTTSLRKEKITQLLQDDRTDIDWENMAVAVGETAFGLVTGTADLLLGDKYDRQSVLDVWKKSDKNQAIEDFLQIRESNASAITKNLEKVLVNGTTMLTDISAQELKLSNLKYSTPAQLAFAKKTMLGLANQKKDILKVMEEKYQDVSNDLAKNPDTDALLDKAKRNYGYVPLLVNNAKASAGDLAIGTANLISEGWGLYSSTVGYIDDNYLGDTGAGEVLGGILNPVYGITKSLGIQDDISGFSDDVLGYSKTYIQETFRDTIAEAKSITDLNGAEDLATYFMATTGQVGVQIAAMAVNAPVGLALVVSSSMGNSLLQDNAEMQESNEALKLWEKGKPKQEEGETNENFASRMKDYNMLNPKPNVVEYSDMQMWGGAMTTGALELATGYFIKIPLLKGKSVVGGLSNRVRAFNSPAMKSAFSNRFAKITGKTFEWAGDTILEGAEEVGVGIGDAYYDRYIMGKTDVNIFEGAWDNFSAGMIGGVGFKSFGLVQPYLQAVQTPGDKSNISGLQQNIKDSTEVLVSNPKMSQNSKDILMGDINGKLLGINNSVNNSLNIFTELNETDFNSLGSLDMQLHNVNLQIEAIAQDPNITVGKQKLIDDLTNQSNNLNGQKNKLLEPYVKTEPSAPGAVVAPVVKMQEGASVVADQLGGGIQRFDTTEDLLGAFASLEAQGVVVDVKKNDQGEILDAVDQDYGLIARVPDGEGGFENQIIINNASSEAQGLLPADKHEVLHLAALTMDPAKKVQFGKDLYNSLKNDKNLNVSKSTLDLIEEYKVDLDDGKLSEADFYEEVMAVTSDGLTDGSVSVVDVNKVKSIGQRFLEAVGWSQNFDGGTGVINFLKDFNTDVLKGEGLSQNVLSQVQGNTEGDVSNVKKSKKPLSEDTKAYMEVDNDVLQQGLITEITNKGDGQFSIAEALTEKNWPLISKSLDINSETQMDAAKEIAQEQLLGVFEGSGQGKYPARKTSALAGFSLDPQAGSPAAQVSTYLAETIRRRKPEIDIAIKERTGSSTELNLDKASSIEDSSTTNKTSKPRGKRSPKKDKTYNEVLSNNLGSEVAPAIDAAIKADLAVAKKSNRFGDTKNIGQKLGETLGKTFGLNPKVFTDKSWNIKKGDLEGLTNLKQYLNSNAINDFKLLPDAYNDKGKSNFIPDNILNKLYVKDGKGKWKLDPTKTVADYKALLGPIEGAVYRASEATTIKGLAGLSFRSMVFETAVPDISNRISEGVKFSKRRRDAILKKAEQKPLNNKDAADIAFFQETIVKIMPQFVPAVIINSNNFASAKDKFGRGHFMTGSNRPSILAEATNNQSDFSKDQIKSVQVAIGSKAFFTTKDGVRQSIDYGSKKYQQKVEQNYAGLELILNGLAKMVQKFPATLSVVSAIFDSASSNSGHFIRQGAIPRGEDTGFKEAGFKGEKEHTMPQNEAGLLMFEAIKNNTVSDLMGYLRNNYFMIGLSLDANSKLKDTSGQYGDAFNYGDIIPKDIMESILKAQKNGDMSKAKSIWGRYFNDNVNKVRGGIDSNTLSFDGKPVADIRGVGNVTRASKKNPNIKHAQSALISEQINNDLSKKDAGKRIKAYEPVAKLEFDAGKRNVELQGDKINPAMTIADQLTMLGTYDTAASKARDLNAPKKGISVFDFDDTLAKTKEKVIVNKADGSTIEISAAKFAEQASNLEAEGATFDFSNFDDVVNAKKGPLADLALKRQDKFGSKDIFVLTARPQIAATGIKTFLDGIGLNLPLKNITGLENGTPGAKGNWVAKKAADGYNDFYFADDAYKNVEAVQEVLSQVNVDSEVQIARSSKKKTFDTVFNDIIENATGIKSEAEFSPARAQTMGEGKGKRTFFTTPSAEDFNGLLYKLLGKGKKGDAQTQFFKDNLIDPYNKAEIAVTNAKTQAANDYKVLKRNLTTLPKSLSKPTGIGGFTYSQAARVAIWTRQGMEVPGLSKRDAKELNDFVSNDPEMNTFVDEMQKIQKGKLYPAPGKTWLGGTITSDVINNINKVNRAEYLEEWQQNIDIVFSEKNYSKLEAAYGPRYVEAMKDQIARMKSGSNRPIGGSRIVNNLLDWLNNSVGAVMFLNTKSAVLQTISAVNFLNWGDNNMVAAGKAFANQPQFWKDFKTLMNSPYLTERRDGLKINVSESEIADAVAESSNKPKAAISYLLNKGFIFTRIADSFAIAAGGSTFYRNRLNALIKSGMDPDAAEKQAFQDFYDIAETNQQSSNPSKISQQQASAAGRVILAFSNTPMQYNRIIKRSTQDLINGRGDWKSNVSKIVYYAGVQNLAFNALQAALFASAFEEEEEDPKQNDKAGRIANGMADSLVRGLGIQGAAVVALKDALTTIYKEANKEKGSPKFDKAIFDMFGFSPPLDAKVRKLKSAANTFSWEKENMKDKGFSLNNPAYLASAQVVSGLTNIPMDRAIQKINNLRAITSNSSENWQKVALAMGWSTWDVGLPYYGVEDKEVQTPQTILRDKVIKMKKETSGKEQKDLLLELGLTKQEIKALKYEDVRIKKILELQEKK